MESSSVHRSFWDNAPKTKETPYSALQCSLADMGGEAIPIVNSTTRSENRFAPQ